MSVLWVRLEGVDLAGEGLGLEGEDWPEAGDWMPERGTKVCARADRLELLRVERRKGPSGSVGADSSAPRFGVSVRAIF